MRELREESWVAERAVRPGFYDRPTDPLDDDKINTGPCLSSAPSG